MNGPTGMNKRTAAAEATLLLTMDGTTEVVPFPGHSLPKAHSEPCLSAGCSVVGVGDAMTLFPMFLKLEGRSCLVVGAGAVGEPKIGSLLTSGASVRVIAPHASSAVAEWARAGAISWEGRDFTTSDLDGIFLVIAATASREVNEFIFLEAQQRNILCNVVDDPEHCDFYYPAVVRRGDLQLAISTNGQSPALAQRIRRELEIQFGPEYGAWLEELGKIRQQLFASAMNPDDRRRLLHELASREAFEQAQSARIDNRSISPEPIGMGAKL